MIYSIEPQLDVVPFYRDYCEIPNLYLYGVSDRVRMGPTQAKIKYFGIRMKLLRMTDINPAEVTPGSHWCIWVHGVSGHKGIILLTGS